MAAVTSIYPPCYSLGGVVNFTESSVFSQPAFGIVVDTYDAASYDPVLQTDFVLSASGTWTLRITGSFVVEVANTGSVGVVYVLLDPTIEEGAVVADTGTVLATLTLDDTAPRSYVYNATVKNATQGEHTIVLAAQVDAEGDNSFTFTYALNEVQARLCKYDIPCRC